MQDPTLQGYVDDKEHGGGCTILKVLADRNIVNKTVFMARKYGGENLFDMRFRLIEQVAVDSLNRTAPMRMIRRKRKATRSVVGTRGRMRSRGGLTRMIPQVEEW